MPTFNEAIYLRYVEVDDRYKYCPFSGLPCRGPECVSSIVEDNYFTGCELINAITSTESVSSINDKLDQILLQLQSMETTESIKLEEIISILSEVEKLSSHVHNLHYHAMSHLASITDQTTQSLIDINDDDIEETVSVKGPKFIPSFQPSVYLLQEFSTGSDTDGNDLIYGKDFMISNQDPEKPSILKSLEQSPYWKTPAVKINYSDYLESIYWKGEPV